MIVTDNETAVDLLCYESIARTVVRLVSKESDEPLSVGVHGDWGAGKSSILMMVEEALAKNEHVLCVRFNGWLFQGFEDAKAVLIETIVDELLRKRSACDETVAQARLVLRQVDWMKAARKAGIYGLSVVTGIPYPETLKDLAAAARAVMARGGDESTAENIATLLAGSNDLLRKVETDGAPKHIHAFREEFGELLKRANIDRFVVLVDDLDRCLPQIAIETLEAIRLFLFVPRAAFVIAADEGMIEYAVRQHFPDLPVTAGPTSYTRNYLEKLIQVPFRLPALGYVETRIYVTLLLILNDCGENSDTFSKIVDLAQEVLRRPWKGLGLERTAISEVFDGSVPEAVERALELSGQIAPILADGARGNPRQIKRFINTMMLRLAIAEERGFQDELNISVLAKIMLAESFAPEIYDSVARGSANTGASQDLAALEATVLQQDTVNSETKSPVSISPPDWPNLEWAKQWAAIKPSLAQHDLRPYVFITRDRHSVFGVDTSLRDLDKLIVKLQGAPLQVKRASSEVARLQAPEAEQVFDALLAKVHDTEDFAEEPAGVHGLAELSRHHPFLQAPFLTFLKELPVSRLGPWAVSGWKGVFSEPDAKTRFDGLLDEWQKQDENRPLKAAAKAAIKLAKTRRHH